MDTVCSLKDMPRTIDDRDEWAERKKGREVLVSSMTR